MFSPRDAIGAASQDTVHLRVDLLSNLVRCPTSDASGYREG